MQATVERHNRFSSDESSLSLLETLYNSDEETMYWMQLINLVVLVPLNGNHDHVLGYTLDIYQIMVTLYLWSFTFKLDASVHNFI